MLLLVKPEHDLPAIQRELLLKIQNWLNNDVVNGVPVPGIARAEYLGPPLTTAASIETTTNNPGTIRTEPSNLSAQVVVLVSLSSFLVVLVMLAVYRYRSDVEREEGTLTVEPRSELTYPETPGSNGRGRSRVVVSPFSEMLPGAYRMGSEMSMSAILEGDSDTASNARCSEIMVSDSGYTTEDDSVTTQTQGLDYANLQSLADAPVLGAQKLVDDEEDDLLFDTGLNMASVP